MRELDFRLHNILIYEIGEGKGGKCSEKENICFVEKKKTEKEKKENIWRRKICGGEGKEGKYH